VSSDFGGKDPPLAHGRAPVAVDLAPPPVHALLASRCILTADNGVRTRGGQQQKKHDSYSLHCRHLVQHRRFRVGWVGGVLLHPTH
jgi:hypothetical protein